jgi:hypothetical protein
VYIDQDTYDHRGEDVKDRDTQGQDRRDLDTQERDPRARDIRDREGYDRSRNELDARDRETTGREHRDHRREQGPRDRDTIDRYTRDRDTGERDTRDRGTRERSFGRRDDRDREPETREREDRNRDTGASGSTRRAADGGSSRIAIQLDADASPEEDIRRVRQRNEEGARAGASTPTLPGAPVHTIVYQRASAIPDTLKDVELLNVTAFVEQCAEARKADPDFDRRKFMNAGVQRTLTFQFSDVWKSWDDYTLLEKVREKVSQNTDSQQIRFRELMNAEICTLDWQSQNPAQECVEKIFVHMAACNFIGDTAEDDKLTTMPGDVRKEVILALVERTKREVEKSGEIADIIVWDDIVKKAKAVKWADHTFIEFGKRLYEWVEDARAIHKHEARRLQSGLKVADREVRSDSRDRRAEAAERAGRDRGRDGYGVKDSGTYSYRERERGTGLTPAVTTFHPTTRGKEGQPTDPDRR